MPRKGYRVMSIKEESFLRFQKAADDARKVFPNMDNSRFLDLLLEVREQQTPSRKRKNIN